MTEVIWPVTGAICKSEYVDYDSGCCEEGLGEDERGNGNEVDVKSHLNQRTITDKNAGISGPASPKELEKSRHGDYSGISLNTASEEVGFRTQLPHTYTREMRDER